MKIAYSHLIKNIEGNPLIDDLSDKLFQLGHEHEVEDEIFNFEFTPNRGDCLSLRGLLRDLNIFYNVRIDNDIFVSELNDLSIEFKNNVKDFCTKISFLKVEIDKVPQDYNSELRDYFSDLGNKKNNFFTDISNYISYETGQPTHCYDSSKIGNKLVLDKLKSNKKFETLIDKTLELQESEYVFFDDQNEVTNFAGVMGGKKTSCNEQTTSVIIECAYFNPEMIIGKTIKYSINSDAAYKFERNTDHSSHDYVLRRFLKIIEKHAKILEVSLYTESYAKHEKTSIKFDYNLISRIIGMDLNKKTIDSYLQKLGFEFDDVFIKVPSHRHDIQNLNDIAEEVARAVGYDNINSKPIEIFSKNKYSSKNEDEEFKLRKLLTDNGFYEVINDPFVSIFDKVSIEVDNPIDSNKKYLRITLEDSLLNNLLYNERRQKDSVKLFEIADVYSTESDQSKKKLGIIASGRVDKNFKDFNKIITNKFINNFLEKNFVTNKKINYKNISREGLNSKSKNPIIFCEVEIDNGFEVLHNLIESNKNINYSYVPFSDFPSSYRDLSFSIKDFKSSKNLQEYVLNFKDDLLKETFVFDYFYNEKAQEIKIGFRFIFQSTSSTITDYQVNDVMDVIIKHATKLKGVSIPGLK